MKKCFSIILALLVLTTSLQAVSVAESATSEVHHAGIVIDVPSTHSIDVASDGSYYNISFNNDRDTFITWSNAKIDPLESALFEFFVSSVITPIQNSGFNMDDPIYKIIDDRLYGIVDGNNNSGSSLTIYIFHMGEAIHLLGFCSPGEHTEADKEYFLSIVLGARTEEENAARANAGIYESQYKEQCQPYTYKAIARNPEKTKGSFAVVSGEVIQVIETGLEVVMRVNITQESWGYTDTIYVTYTRTSNSEDRILEDDIITIWGELAGMTSYETIFGSTTSVPKLEAKYIQIDFGE